MTKYKNIVEVLEETLEEPLVEKVENTGLKYITLMPPVSIPGPEIIIGIPKDKKETFETFRTFIETEVPGLSMSEEDICDEHGEIIQERLYLAMIGALNAAFALHQKPEFSKLLGQIENTERILN